ncbi:hypothetical protein NPIL_94021 [Nephila pilipes]|uniref:Uncharacterized protein n=1 Tax=Nephila pilipes TaxID=299642 RepID=A0A8X6Q2R9_NEPPI|nr:hypothetical protein NPIL_94021 [Nephila pilipes]
MINFLSYNDELVSSFIPWTTVDFEESSLSGSVVGRFNAVYYKITQLLHLSVDSDLFTMFKRCSTLLPSQQYQQQSCIHKSVNQKEAH